MDDDEKMRGRSQSCRAILDAIDRACKGEPVSEIEASFPLVRAVMDVVDAQPAAFIDGATWGISTLSDPVEEARRRWPTRCLNS